MRKRMESIKNTANNSNLNSIELTYLKKRKGLILNGEIKRDEDFDLLIQKLQKDHNNKCGILGNNNLGSVFKMDSLEKGITTDYESVFCLLKEGANEYNIEFKNNIYRINKISNYKKSSDLTEDLNYSLLMLSK